MIARNIAQRADRAKRPLILAFGVLVLLGAGFCVGYITKRHDLLPKPIRDALGRLETRLVRSAPKDEMPGRWEVFHGSAAPTSGSQHFAELHAIGYLSGYDEAPDSAGIIVFDRDRAMNGLNLFTSGHEAGAYLMNMEGQTLHEWQYNFWDIWPNFEPVLGAHSDNTDYWRRVWLYENGDLLAIFEGIGIIKLDSKSNLIWANQCQAHHDLTVTDDGDIYVLTRKIHIVERINTNKPIVEDFISVLTPRGEITREISILECFENSDYASILGQGLSGDIFHTNTLEMIGGEGSEHLPPFSAGRILISVRNLNAIAVLDLAHEQIVWCLEDMWRMQHDPTLLSDNRLLIFDNIGNDGQSRVLELDPYTQEVLWRYGEEEGERFHSAQLGTVQRLSNLNTLITVSDNGVAF